MNVVRLIKLITISTASGGGVLLLAGGHRPVLALLVASGVFRSGVLIGRAADSVSQQLREHTSELPTRRNARMRGLTSLNPVP